MILFKKAKDLSGWLTQQRNKGLSVGFVPTMGALHAGHISLIDISKKSTGVTVCSIFVNPTQFNDPKDFQKYPITIENDILLLERAGTDALFLPEADEVYPRGTSGLEQYALGPLEDLLEGKYRPGHFQGVCQVMRRLLDLVGPDDLFMGQKDYQQCMVVRRLLEIMGVATKLHPCPIVRETDGLAMSSRNMRLSEVERKRSTAIYRALILIKEGRARIEAAGDGEATGTEGQWGKQVAPVDQLATADQKIGLRGEQMRDQMEEVLQQARALLEQNGFRIDYISVADGRTLEPVTGIDQERQEGQQGKEIVALIAAFQGEVRLIDNMTL